MIEILNVQDREIHYIGILANVDDSILDLELEHGFEVTKHIIDSSDDDFKILMDLLGSEYELLLKYDEGSCVSLDYNINNDADEYVIYCIKNSFKGDSAKIYNEKYCWGVAERKVIFHPSTDIKDKKENDLVSEYLYPSIKKMRLYRKGNICIPFNYFYFVDNNVPELVSSLDFGYYIIDEEYSLEKSEINEFNRFIKEIEIPFSHNELQLAFENFELSYEIQNLNMQFLTLMNALEVLLKIGNTELSYKLSRNGAILLGKDKDTSERIYKTLKCLYNIRSSIVHTGKPKQRKNTDKPLDEQMIENISILREYVRDSIKEVNFIIKKEGKNKEEILEMLNEYGFGERPWHNI